MFCIVPDFGHICNIYTTTYKIQGYIDTLQ